MQIVIDIPDIMYKSVCDGTYKHWKSFQAVVEHGTVLPENHGRLIDGDCLFRNVGDITPKSQIEHDNIGDFMSLITYAPTIIEAKR